ncbi:MAG: DUF3667 domain-containing protein [Lacunisphaera sp.]
MSQAPRPCATCSEPLTGKYCVRCGEKRVSPGDHTVRRFLEQLVEGFTNADGKIFLTLRLLLTRPGRLTADYLRGRRQPYIPALQLFLIANLIFFLLHPLLGSNTLTTDLHTHLHYTWHAALAEAMVRPRLVARALTPEAYAAIFDPASVTQAKSLIILVVPVFSLAVAALYWRQRREYAPHLIFALHFCSFWLLLICGALALTNLAVRLLRVAAIFPSAVVVSRSVLCLTLIVMALYLFRAVRVVFAPEAAWLTVTKALALGVALDLSLQAYRFVLFFITFWST